MAINKVVFKTETLIDLTSDTAVASDVAEGKTFHDASGALVTGTASGGGTKYEEEDLPGGGICAKINCSEGPDYPPVEWRVMHTGVYMQSISSEIPSGIVDHKVYVYNYNTGKWDEKYWSGSSWSVGNYCDHDSESETYKMTKFRFKLESGYHIDPTIPKTWNEYKTQEIGSVGYFWYPNYSSYGDSDAYYEWSYVTSTPDSDGWYYCDLCCDNNNGTDIDVDLYLRGIPNS